MLLWYPSLAAYQLGDFVSLNFSEPQFLPLTDGDNSSIYS